MLLRRATLWSVAVAPPLFETPPPLFRAVLFVRITAVAGATFRMLFAPAVRVASWKMPPPSLTAMLPTIEPPLIVIVEILDVEAWARYRCPSPPPSYDVLGCPALVPPTVTVVIVNVP